MFLRLRYRLGRGCALLPVSDMRSGRAHLLLLLVLLEDLEQIMEDPDEIAEEIPATDVAELGQRMIDFVTTIRQDTNEIYGRLDDAQDDRSLMSGVSRVFSKVMVIINPEPCISKHSLRESLLS
ncbi:hypothetical protein Tco_0499124 [Tanacetum coccineum]